MVREVRYVRMCVRVHDVKLRKRKKNAHRLLSYWDRERESLPPTHLYALNTWVSYHTIARTLS